jgi:hypothetical protein
LVKAIRCQFGEALPVSLAQMAADVGAQIEVVEKGESQ